MRNRRVIGEAKCLELFVSVFSRVHATLYPTVSVRRLVGRSVGRSVTHLFFWRFSGSFCITAPAQSHATDSAVYTALFKKNHKHCWSLRIEDHLKEFKK